MTLVEVIVALGIFGVVSLAVCKGIATHIAFNVRSEERSGAVIALQQALDQIRLSDPATLPTSGSTSMTITLGALVYTVTTTYCPTYASSYCTSNNIRYLSSTVTLNGRTLLTSDTAFTQLR